MTAVVVSQKLLPKLPDVQWIKTGRHRYVAESLHELDLNLRTSHVKTLDSLSLTLNLAGQMKTYQLGKCL